MTDSVGGRVVLKLSKKYDVSDPLARPLVTTYLTPEEYALFAALRGHWLRKRRHAVPSASGEFGIDLFEGALEGLELAEIEQPDAASLAAVELPEWARSEVTYDADFQGGTFGLLARSRAETFVGKRCDNQSAPVCIVRPGIVVDTILASNGTSRDWVKRSPTGIHIWWAICAPTSATQYSGTPACA